MVAHLLLAAGMALSVPSFGLGPDGFYFGNRDPFQLRLRTVLQGDGRFYFGDDANVLSDTFLVRRARLYVEGSAGELFEFRLMPDLGEGKPQLLDAWVNVRVWPWLQLRAGKMKSPFSIERLQEERNRVFVEPGLTTNLAPDRDVGAMIHGELGPLRWQAGVFDGVGDAGSGDGDNADAKDLEARVFAKPIPEFGVGIAATYGREHGSALLAAPRTGGQTLFFSYLPDVVADGDHARISPQAHAYVGPFGILTEYVRSTQRISRGGAAGTFTNDAWQVEASFIVTMEKASYEGVVPKHPIHPAKMWFGAFEIGARYGELRMDAGVFPYFADPEKTARAAFAWAFVANWYLTRNFRAEVQFERTIFRGSTRLDENVLLARLQVAF